VSQQQLASHAPDVRLQGQGATFLNAGFTIAVSTDMLTFATQKQLCKVCMCLYGKVWWSMDKHGKVW